MAVFVIVKTVSDGSCVINIDDISFIKETMGGRSEIYMKSGIRFYTEKSVKDLYMDMAVEKAINN